MAVTIVVLSGAEPGAPQLSLTLDSPRIVIGRGESCDLRVPDTSVSHRHASIRQRGAEYVLQDENSENGTFMDKVRLPPLAPRGLRNGERVRVGRVWLEVRFEPVMVKGSTAALAKQLALALVARGIAAASGVEPDPDMVASALAEIERSPLERMSDDEAPNPPGGATPTPPPAAAANEATPTPAPAAPLARGEKSRTPAEQGGWGALDSVVVFLALGVLALSVLGAFWLLGR
jgi:predicted component of type VI protein secretion system